MKKWLLALLTALAVFALAACGGSDDKKDEKAGKDGGKDDKEIVIGASNVPHAVILEEAKPLLEKKGYDLKIETFQDYVLPNKSLEEGDLDANYFQHIPYLEGQKKENGYDFVNAGGVHIEPIGVYSKKYKSLNDLPKGAKILMSSSVADHGRILTMLEKEGLIKLKEGVKKEESTLDDIEENKKDLKFEYNYEPALLPQAYNNGEGDAVLINSNYAIDNGLNPLKDSIAIEDKESPYVNVVAVRKEDENSEKIKALIEVLHSKEIQDFILKEWNGAIVPVNK
ncbi:MetQ/NlpA family ABC transporter substrate-binding protein [Pseudobacillus badius]|uniref:MetQ/NlpA family ABC transporter substrate-binding protein n=1 Tax=Bacillus badius TaxID=1455 RepID=UPI0007B0A50E|nr:MetQ/NlpA family ABC transporter substrate-binding protein [Bacillus badius]KZN99497.1 methionine ABC transporter substrate-binding protein [Bacillus badius]MED0667825.1 MetQ/NlpA family ABC transporter substrate-binding protein [Bacillus badius]OCS85334.1 methionine ABC transporter substrate-binding protein [Bacillus badius]OVE50385.1 methionine ABC transporter substrate-binding protein [Bacillus badius]TDW01282.1 D-methionine transport system substrate-binding protein [Bacillus badius]